MLTSISPNVFSLSDVSEYGIKSLNYSVWRNILYEKNQPDSLSLEYSIYIPQGNIRESYISCIFEFSSRPLISSVFIKRYQSYQQLAYSSDYYAQLGKINNTRYIFYLELYNLFLVSENLYVKFTGGILPYSETISLLQKDKPLNLF